MERGSIVFVYSILDILKHATPMLWKKPPPTRRIIVFTFFKKSMHIVFPPVPAADAAAGVIPID